MICVHFRVGLVGLVNPCENVANDNLNTCFFSEAARQHFTHMKYGKQMSTVNSNPILTKLTTDGARLIPSCVN